MQLVILRHGRTRANEDDLYVGAHLDPPLSENGRADARACGIDENERLVYVSPMLRARETARICFPRARQIPIEDLREMDFGVFEGRSPDSMKSDTRYRAWVDSWCTIRCPGGEDRRGFTSRVENAITSLAVIAQREKPDRIIVVAHGGTILATMNALVRERTEAHNERESYFKWHVGNAEGYIAEIEFENDTHPILTHPVHFASLKETR